MQSEADHLRTRHLLEGLEFVVVQDIFRTKTAEIADVVFPASAMWAESEGTVTNSERRVQRVRRALQPPGEARDDLDIVVDLARAMGTDFGHPTAEDVWNEVRRLSPVHAGMSYARLEAEDGLQWPCYDEHAPGRALPPQPALGGSRSSGRGRRSASSITTRRSTSSTTSSPSA